MQYLKDINFNEISFFRKKTIYYYLSPFVIISLLLAGPILGAWLYMKLDYSIFVWLSVLWVPFITHKSLDYAYIDGIDAKIEDKALLEQKESIINKFYKNRVELEELIAQCIRGAQRGDLGWRFLEIEQYTNLLMAQEEKNEEQFLKVIYEIFNNITSDMKNGVFSGVESNREAKDRALKVVSNTMRLAFMANKDLGFDTSRGEASELFNDSSLAFSANKGVPRYMYSK